MMEETLDDTDIHNIIENTKSTRLRSYNLSFKYKVLVIQPGHAVIACSMQLLTVSIIVLRLSSRHYVKLISSIFRGRGQGHRSRTVHNV